MSTKEDEDSHTPLPEVGDMTLEEDPPRVVSTWADPNPQLSSPLFSGRIPGEIRNLIFDFALTENPSPSPNLNGCDLDVHPNHDPDPPSGAASVVQSRVRMAPSAKYMWPGCLGPNFIYTSLLRTCRLVYLETAHLPPRHKQVVYYGSLSDWFPQSGPLGDWQPLQPPPSKKPPMLPLHAITALQRAHLFLSVSYLESQFEPLVRRGYHRIHPSPRFHSAPAPSPSPPVRIFSSLVHLRLTIRRTAWRGWNEPGMFPGEPGGALGINPFANSLTRIARSSGPDGARGAMAAAMENPSPVAEPGSWASAFAMMPALQTLTIDFETSADRAREMEAIVEWARRAWRFAVMRNPPLPVYVDPKTGVEGTWVMSGVEQRMAGLGGEYKWFAKHDVLGREKLPEGLPTADGRPVSRVWLVPDEKAGVERWKWRWYPWTSLGFCQCDKKVAWRRLEECKDCLESIRLRNEEAKGQRLLVWTLRWTAREEEGEVARTEEERGVVLPARTKEEEETRYDYVLFF